MNTVTYHFEDGTKQVTNINEQVMFDEKGRRRSDNQINELSLS